MTKEEREEEKKDISSQEAENYNFEELPKYDKSGKKNYLFDQLEEPYETLREY